ncbi:MAG: PEP-CTERM sorting domain-containing protein [Comamonadaceae bacterium]|nr:PEP-CTERM sorting domain-containing protein [Comamonadaceae bacterium]
MNLNFLATAAAVAGSMAAGSASAMWVVPLTDTTSSLALDWSWSDPADGLAGTTYTGAHWEATLKAVFGAGVWTLDATYRHLDGPHGEIAESSSHSHTAWFVPGVTGGMPAIGVEDHLLPAVHPDAHSYYLFGNGPLDPGKGAFATLHVTHVPEPAAWMLMAGGLAAAAAWRRRMQGRARHGPGDPR